MFGSFLVFSNSMLFVNFCKSLFIFWFFAVPDCIAIILKYSWPDSHHWFRDEHLFLSSCQSCQTFLNHFWKVVCFKIDVFSSQYWVPKHCFFYFNCKLNDIMVRETIWSNWYILYFLIFLLCRIYLFYCVFLGFYCER